MTEELISKDTLTVHTTNMAPISPESLKRSSSSSQSGDDMDMPSSKRRRLLEPALPQTPPPEEEYAPPPRERSFNDDPNQLLLRSIALALKHVGFDSAKPDAMEALRGQVESYAMRFLSQITSSMLNARRSQPIPVDFEYALQKLDLPLGSLTPHLNPPIPAYQTQIQLEALPAEPEDTRREKERISTLLLGDELNGALDMKSKPYIPKNFIPFPSKHTYKWTEPEVKNQKDRRKIREEAAKVSRQAEEALRRFVNVVKSGKEKDVKNAAGRDPKTKKTHELWENVMGNLMVDSQPSVARGRNDDEDQSMIVNSESQYFRKGGPAKTKATIIAELRI